MTKFTTKMVRGCTHAGALEAEEMPSVAPFLVMILCVKLGPRSKLKEVEMVVNTKIHFEACMQ